MLNSISFGNGIKYVNEATIFSKEEIAKVAGKVTKSAKEVSSKIKDTKAEYTSPYAATIIDTTAPKQALSAAEESFALSHGNPILGQNINYTV